MRNLSHEKLLLIALAILMAVHFVVTILNTIPEPHLGGSVAEYQAKPIKVYNYEITQENLANFSLAYGIKPTFTEVKEAVKNEVVSFASMAPKLLAVDKQGEKLNAVIILTMNKEPEIVRLALNETVHDYRLAKLSLTQAVFTNGSDEVVLEMFSTAQVKN